MEIQNEETETKGAFFIEEGGKRQAEMVYSKAGPARIIIEHTEVSEALKGKNVGKQLVRVAGPSSGSRDRYRMRTSNYSASTWGH